jgi:deferrochelatase/peroxidase EfeB
MTNNIAQEGIFYSNGEKIGKSCCIMFFNFTSDCNLSQASIILKRLWKTYGSLKKGITGELREAHPKQLHTGNPTFLLGYGPGFFSINGIKKEKPEGLGQLFIESPDPLKGGGPVINDANIFYGPDIKNNHVLNDQIILQCIAESDFYIYRVIVETWKELQLIKKENDDKELIILCKYYLGYQPVDRRNWFGFIDGISNIEKEKREDAIFIKKNRNGESVLSTYMVFSRIDFELEKWVNLSKYEQERIIGRDKITGCPIMGFDESTGKTLKDPKCPVLGTVSVLESGNEVFREINPNSFPTHLFPRNYLPVKDSHVLSSRRDNYKIFRQSFDFFEPNENKDNFIVGINFISFQNNVRYFFDIFKYSLQELGKYTSIDSIGVFYIPSTNMDESFPGEKTLFI